MAKTIKPYTQKGLTPKIMPTYRKPKDALYGIYPNNGPSRGYELRIITKNGIVVCESLSDSILKNKSHLEELLPIAQVFVNVLRHRETVLNYKLGNTTYSESTLDCKIAVKCFYGRHQTVRPLCDGEIVDGVPNKTVAYRKSDILMYRIDTRDTTNEYKAKGSSLEFDTFMAVQNYLEKSNMFSKWFNLTQMMIEVSRYTGFTSSQMIRSLKDTFNVTTELPNDVQLDQYVDFYTELLKNKSSDLDEIISDLRKAVDYSSYADLIPTKKAMAAHNLIAQYHVLADETDLNQISHFDYDEDYCKNMYSKPYRKSLESIAEALAYGCDYDFMDTAKALINI